MTKVKSEKDLEIIGDKSGTDGDEQSYRRISLSLPGGGGEACGKVKTTKSWQLVKPYFLSDPGIPVLG